MEQKKQKNPVVALVILMVLCLAATLFFGIQKGSLEGKLAEQTKKLTDAVAKKDKAVADLDAKVAESEQAQTALTEIEGKLTEAQQKLDAGKATVQLVLEQAPVEEAQE